jgi:hypothetical protein
MAAIPEERTAPPTKDEIEAGVLALFVQHNYVDADGEKDLGPMREVLFDAVSPADVARKSERGEKAALEDDLVETAFPYLPDVEETEDRELAEAIEKAATATVQRALDLAPSGGIQKLVKERMPGYLLCRTKVGKKAKTAYYVTKDVACILEDYAAGPAKKVRSAATTLASYLAEATDRQPQNANKYDREYKRDLKLALDAGANTLAPALTAALEDLSEDDE